ncbi:MAG TPA: hypothetical protein VGC66_05225 [Pyrinomonadaceae bacterium]
MKRAASRAGKYSQSTFLCALVGLCLCLSLSGSLLRMPVPVSAKDADVPSTSIGAAELSLRAHALTSSRDAGTGSAASKQSRGKNSTAHLTTALPERFGLLKAAVRRLSLRSRASLNYSSLSISRPKGRAPPVTV